MGSQAVVHNRNPKLQIKVLIRAWYFSVPFDQSYFSLLAFILHSKELNTKPA